ncbi:PQQ-binding-like beta-propeller repeat protein [Bacteroidales bacterium OttesenSCG-928-M11]|nr:PQQ-binding-like beta-propeller repeat protein [Bacteroidales bacterium OttesenSCG-928-M11]
MRLILITLSLLFTITASAKKKEDLVLKNERVIGKTVDGTHILGTEYIFPERVHEAFLYKDGGLLTIQSRNLRQNGVDLSNGGKIFQYDINNDTLLWSKKISYSKESILQFDNTLIFNYERKVQRLDAYTGKKMWELRSNINYIDPHYNIGIGYNLEKHEKYNELQGADLNRGKLRWTRSLNINYGWSDTFYMNDSVLVVVSDGLHTINLRNGEGWDYKVKTGERSYKRSTAINAAGIATGLLFGVFFYSTGYDVISDLSSNVLLDDKFIYFASKEQIVRLEKSTGDIDWRKPLPNKDTSKSFIFMNDSTVFLINGGWTYVDGVRKDMGVPFITAYDKNSGFQKFLVTLDKKEDPIFDYERLGDNIYLLFKNRMRKYSAKTGELLLDKFCSEEQFGEITHFVDDKVFIAGQDELMYRLIDSDLNKVFVHTKDGHVLAIDEDLNVSEIINSSELNVNKLSSDDFLFLSRNHYTEIYNHDGEKIAVLDIPSDSFLIDGVLYAKKDNSFFAIDLDQLKEKQ